MILAPAAASSRGPQPIASIQASAVNQDGRSSGLTAPNGPSQTTLIRDAIKAGGISSQDLAFVAVHGTGTPLGDPIEVGGLGGALKSQSTTSIEHRPVMGSVKACFGHTEGAAGITGMHTSLAASWSGSAI